MLAESTIHPDREGHTPRTHHEPGTGDLVSDDRGSYQLREGGSLRDISPTLRGTPGLEKPGRMSGGDLRYTVRPQ